MSSQSQNIAVGVYLPDAGLVPLQCEGQDVVLKASNDSGSARTMANHVYTDAAQPQEVYDDFMSDLVDKCIDGYNSTVLLHGLHDLQNEAQRLLTGEGHSGGGGLLRLAATQLFEHIHTRSGAARREVQADGGAGADSKGEEDFLVLASVYVVDGVKDVFDLLLPREGQKEVGKRSKLMRFRPTGSYCDELARLEITSASELCELYEQAMALLPLVTPTGLRNPHVVVDLRLEAVYRENPYVVRTSLFRVVHMLQGKDTLMQYTSPDVVGLNKCSFGVSKKAAKYDVPVDARALTLLLTDFLGGNALAVCIAVVSAPESHRGKGSAGLPSDSHYYIALAQTLGFLSTTAAIETKPKVNKSTIQASISELRSEVSKIGKKLAEHPSTSISSSSTSSSSSNLDSLSSFSSAQESAALVATLQALVTELARIKKCTMLAKREQAIQTRIARQEALSEQGWDLLLSRLSNARSAVKPAEAKGGDDGLEDDDGEEARGLKALEDRAVHAFDSVMGVVEQHSEVTARYERMKGRYERKFKVDYHKRDRSGKGDKKKGQEQLERDIATTKHDQIMLSEDLHFDAKEVAEILDNNGTEGLVGLGPYNLYMAALSRYIDAESHHDGLYLLPEERVQAQLLRAGHLRKPKLRDGDLVMSHDVRVELQELEDLYGRQVKQIDRYDSMPDTEAAATLKRVARAMVDGHYKEQRQFLLKRAARNFLLHLTVKHDQEKDRECHGLKSQMLMMFREYRSHFDSMKNSNEEASAALAGQATTDVLELFEQNRILSEQLDAHYLLR
jgi:hypothetical protein